MDRVVLAVGGEPTVMEICTRISILHMFYISAFQICPLRYKMHMDS